MTDKSKTSFTIAQENVPTILRLSGAQNDPNLQDVPQRDIPRYLRERYWIKQWKPTERWKRRGLFSISGSMEWRLADLGRKLDEPGDAFFDLFLFTSRFHVHLRTWAEVTEVFLPEHAPKVNHFIQKYNNLRGKGEIDTDEFLRTLNYNLPDADLQRKMANEVILAIRKKAEKGREGGSYESLVHDYGRGVLIIGLPLWFAALPTNPTEPITFLTDFMSCLALGVETIKHSVLQANWCPFDSITVFWNPTLESIDSWAKVADPHFYSDPTNLRWKTPFSFLQLHSFLKNQDFPMPKHITNHCRWDRYSSLDSMLADQRRWLRFPNSPRPLGPKACLEVIREKRSPRLTFYLWLFQFWLFVRTQGWQGLRRWIFSRFSVRRLYSRLRLKYQARILWRKKDE